MLFSEIFNLHDEKFRGNTKKTNKLEIEKGKKRK